MNAPVVRFLSLGDLRTDRRIKNFIGFFSAQGYRTELIYANHRISHSDPDISVGDTKITEIRLDYTAGVKMYLQYHSLLRQQLTQAEPCDILFASELFSLRAAAKIKSSGKTKKLFYDARELYTELPSVADNLLKKLFWKRWERRGLKQTDLVIVTAPDDTDAIKQVHKFLPPSIVVRNLPNREELRANNYLRNYFTITHEKKIFVYVGGLQKDRGLEKMIEAMPTLKDHAAFIMIGDGIVKNDLQNKVRELGLDDTVYFHPAIDSDKVIEILSSADVGISLIEQHSKSYQFALPSKIFEYMLAGLPVISSPLKQVRDLFDNNEGVVFAEPDDKSALIEACKKALSLSDIPDLRKNIHEEASNTYTFEMDVLTLKNYLSNNI